MLRWFHLYVNQALAIIAKVDHVGIVPSGTTIVVLFFFFDETIVVLWKQILMWPEATVICAEASMS